jgi:hypothetical protein
MAALADPLSGFAAKRVGELKKMSLFPPTAKKGMFSEALGNRRRSTVFRVSEFKVNPKSKIPNPKSKYAC